MIKCSKHKTVMTYRAGKENVLFCKKCEKKKPSIEIKKSIWSRIKRWLGFGN